MMTRWHLLNLPVRCKDRLHLRLTVEEVLIDWPRPTVTGFLVRRRFRPWVIYRGPGVTLTPFGVAVDSIRRFQHPGRKWLSRELAKTAAWLRAPVVDDALKALGWVVDLALSEDASGVTGLVVSRGILQDLWSGAFVIPVENLQVLADRRIKASNSGETST